MKVRKIRRFAPCPFYDVERMESWLTDMAAEGKHLLSTGIVLSTFTFAVGEPRQDRYRLEPKPKADGESSERPSQDIVDLCAEYGWEFVTACGQFYIYRSLSPDAREMHTDPEVQAAALKVMKQRIGLSNLALLFPSVHMLYSFFKEPYRYLATFGPVYTLSLVTFFLGAWVFGLIRAIRVHALHKKLQQNIPLDHQKPWRRQAWLHHATQIAVIMIYFLFFATMLTQCSGSISQSGTPISAYGGDPPIITIADLCPEGSYTQERFVDGYNEFLQTGNSAAPVILEWKEYGQLTTPEGEVYSGFISVTYYETRSPWIAEGLFRDYLRDARRNKYYEDYPLPALDVDQYIGYDTVAPTVLIQHGNIFISAYCCLDNEEGDNALSLWATLMAEALNKP